MEAMQGGQGRLHVPDGLFGGLGGGDQPITYQEAVASSADVLESLESDEGEKILPYQTVGQGSGLSTRRVA